MFALIIPKRVRRPTGPKWEQSFAISRTDEPSHAPCSCLRYGGGGASGEQQVPHSVRNEKAFFVIPHFVRNGKVSQGVTFVIAGERYRIAGAERAPRIEAGCSPPDFACMKLHDDRTEPRLPSAWSARRSFCRRARLRRLWTNICWFCGTTPKTMWCGSWRRICAFRWGAIRTP